MTDTPKIARVGLRGVLITFADSLTDRANMAAIAFRAAVDQQRWGDVAETASTLVSTFVAVDLTVTPYDLIRAKLTALLETRDWYAANLPPGRKLWTLPMCFDHTVAPQFDAAAQSAGLTQPKALQELSTTRTRVITLGFAPGQPYLGMLPPAWDIPRQTDLTPQVPIGALVVAIRQLVLFATSAPTGWHHVGQTAFRPFDPDRATPVALSPGDEVRFATITPAELQDLEAGDSWGGAVWEELP